MNDFFYSIGYERRTFDEFAEVLVGAGIEHVLDVRLRAVSRKPGFSERVLKERLFDEHWITYRHEPLLGNPTENREPLRRRDPQAIVTYRRVITDFSWAIDGIISNARHQRTALMCYERDILECHRGYVAQYIERHPAQMRLIQL